ncbi:MAG: hypothetical protein IJP61_00320 [Treponema sp.]|nr:hypothetical protein [Treponema sp.]
MKLGRDLHSVYIDGEMPKDFIAEYEDIISKDKNEAAELEKMQKIHGLFQKDAADIEVSDKFVEESFARLQMKMKFKENTKKAESKSFVKVMKIPASFAAAAAVFALIFTPAFLKSSSKVEKEVTAIAVAVADEIPAIAEKTVAIDGNINSEKLSDFAVSNTVAQAKEKADNQQTILSPALVEQKVVKASALVTNSGNFRNNMTSVDVFRPELNTMKMTLPEFGNIQEIKEIQNIDK